MDSLIHWCIDSLNHWFIDALIHWFIDSLVHSIIASSNHWLINSFTHWFIDSLIDSLARISKYPCRICQQWTCIGYLPSTCLRSQHFRCPRSGKNHNFGYELGLHRSVRAHTRSDSIPWVPGSLCKPSRVHGSPYSIKNGPKWTNIDRKQTKFPKQCQL